MTSYAVIRHNGLWRVMCKEQESSTWKPLKLYGHPDGWNTQQEAKSALAELLKARQQAERQARRAVELDRPERVTTPDGKVYGKCAECGRMAWLYECYHCQEDDLCWECLVEHKADYHNIDIG